MKIVDVRVEESVLAKKDKDWKFALAAKPCFRLKRAVTHFQIAF
jgi:hypothetical protein